MATLPPTADLTAYGGDTWAQTFRFLDQGLPVDLGGAEVAAWAREPTGANHPLAVTVGPDPGEVTIAYADEPLPFLSWDDYRYDIEVNQGGAIRTWVRGRLKVLRDVTNPGVTPTPPDGEAWTEEFATLDAWEQSDANAGGVNAASGGQWAVTINSPADYVQINTLDDFSTALGLTAEIAFPALPDFLVVGFGLATDPDTSPGEQVFADALGGGSYEIHGVNGSTTFSEAPTNLRIVLGTGVATSYASFNGGADWVIVGAPHTGITLAPSVRTHLYVYGNAGMPDPSTLAVEAVQVHA